MKSHLVAKSATMRNTAECGLLPCSDCRATAKRLNRKAGAIVAITPIIVAWMSNLASVEGSCREARCSR